jgi:putative membrane protein insertion efficiency factor
MRSLALTILSGYKLVVSPWLPTACRFYPTCSEYAHGAIEQYGVVRGSLMALARLGRCHPFHPGGFDPVPERRS